MAAEAEWEDRLFKHAAGMAASAARTATRDGTIPSIGREAIKDVRNTIHEVFFGQPESHNEPGTPLNPTPGEIADDRREDNHPYGFSQSGVNYSMPSPSDIAYDRHKIDNPQNVRNSPDGQVLAQEEKGWRERLEERRQQSTGGSGGYDRQKERIKPEEERQEQKEQERGGRCR